MPHRQSNKTKTHIANVKKKRNIWGTMAKSAKSAQMQMKMHSTTFPAHQHAHTEIGQYAKCVCKLCFGQQFQYFMRPTWRMSNVSDWQKMLCEFLRPAKSMNYLYNIPEVIFYSIYTT